MPRGRKPKNSAAVETTSEKNQKAENVQKNDKPEESDEEMAELPTAVEETKSKRTISKSSAVPKTKKQKKSDDDEEEEEKPTKAQNGKGAKSKATTESETAEEKVTKSQNGKSTKTKAAPESEPMAVDEKTTKNQNGRPSKSQSEPEPAEEKVTKLSGKNAAKTTAPEPVEDKKPAPKRAGRGRPPKQTEKAEKVSDAEPEPVIEKETPVDSNVDDKPAPKRGGKAKNVKQVEKIVADDDDAEPDAEKEAEKEEISADANIDEDSFDSNSKTKDGRKWNFKISTWNVCGMRAWLKKGGMDYLKKENPDVIVLQETKVTENDLTDEMKNVEGYNSHFVKVTGEGGKKGYAGVALYSKTKPISVTFGMGIKEHDIDGRLITAEYEKFYLIGAYVPNSGRGLVRLAQRRLYNKDFLEYVKRLDAKKPVVYCGDLNVAHNEIDLKNPASNKKSAGFTKEEREDFTTLLDSGFVDTFRSLYPKRTGAYTYWSNMSNSRAKNVGWRLDYFVVSKRFEENVCDNVIRSKVMGSDHCPSTLFLAL